MANEYYISAGLIPIDNSSGATANTYYISAGLVPDDEAGGTTYYQSTSGSLGSLAGSLDKQALYKVSLGGAI